MLPVRYFCSNKAFIFCQLNFTEIKRLFKSLGRSCHPQFFGYHQIWYFGVCYLHIKSQLFISADSTVLHFIQGWIWTFERRISMLSLNRTPTTRPSPQNWRWLHPPCGRLSAIAEILWVGLWSSEQPVLFMIEMYPWVARSLTFLLSWMLAAICSRCRFLWLLVWCTGFVDFHYGLGVTSI